MRLWIVATSPNFALDAERNLYTTDGEGTWYANGVRIQEGDPMIPEGFGAPQILYETPAEFLGDDDRRLRSPERDYGVHWRAGGSGWVTHRVSYVYATGELYAVANAGPEVGRVEILAAFPPEDCGECAGAGAASDPIDAYCRGCSGTGKSRDLLEFAIRGWVETCGTPGSLEWLRDRLVEYPAAA